MYDVRAKTVLKNPLDTFAKIRKEVFLCQILQNLKMKRSITRTGVSIWNFNLLSVKTLNISDFRKK